MIKTSSGDWQLMFSDVKDSPVYRITGARGVAMRKLGVEQLVRRLAAARDIAGPLAVC